MSGINTISPKGSLVSEQVRNYSNVVSALLKLPGVYQELNPQVINSGHNREARLISPRLQISSITNLSIPLSTAPVVAKTSIPGFFYSSTHSSDEYSALKRLDGIAGVPKLFDISLPRSDINIEYIKGIRFKELIGETTLDEDIAINLTRQVLRIASSAIDRNTLLRGFHLDDLILGVNSTEVGGVYLIDYGNWFDIPRPEYSNEMLQEAFEYRGLVDELKVLYLWMIIDKHIYDLDVEYYFHYIPERLIPFLADNNNFSHDDRNSLLEIDTLEKFDKFLESRLDDFSS